MTGKRYLYKQAQYSCTACCYQLYEKASLSLANLKLPAAAFEWSRRHRTLVLERLDMYLRDTELESTSEPESPAWSFTNSAFTTRLMV